MTNPMQTGVYRWDDCPSDAPMPMLLRRRMVGVHAMISEIMLDEGCHVPSHSHDNEQFAMVMSGHARFGVGEEGTPDHKTVDVRTGETLYLAPNVPHSVVAIERTRVLDIFSPTSETTGVDR